MSTAVMTWKKPRRRLHSETGVPYDRWAVHVPDPNRSMSDRVPRLVRINRNGWAAPEDSRGEAPLYVGNKRAFRTRLEAERLLAVLILAGDP